MKSRSKTFARKLVALFLAVIMAVSCFTSVVTAFAKSSDGYYDDNLAANFMTWAETTDNQTAEALLDWADMHIDDLILSLGANSDMLKGDHLTIYYDIAVAKIQLYGYLDSIDGILDLLNSANTLVNDYKGLVGGDVKNIDISQVGQLNAPSKAAADVVSKCGVSYRATNDAKDIILALAKLIYTNTNDDSGKNVIGNFLKGTLDLGILGNFVDIYSLLQTPLGLWNGYQSNLVYNIISNLILTKSGWYTDTEIAGYQADIQAGNGNWVLDDQLMDKLSKNLLQQINAEITYGTTGTSANQTESSHDRYQKILNKMDEGLTMKQAAEALGYDSNLKYTTDGNVYLFCYGDQKITINKNTKLLEFGYEVLNMAWKTALKDTLGLVRVNFDRWDNKNYASNYDNDFYYWMRGNGKWDDSKSWESNYTEANVKAWANSEYAYYGAVDADDLLADVQDNLTFDRTVVENATNTWKDIDSTKLFVKLRYSPLADKYFNMQTGPINLYLMQTGFDNLEAFFGSGYSNYADLPALLNDVLVAAVKDLFPESDNIGLQTASGVQSLTRPTMATAGVSKFEDSNVTTNIDAMATTLISNTVKMFEYVANSTDENILNAFYVNHNISNKTASNNLSEANFEEAMVPFLIACLQNIPDVKQIHAEKWDACQDAEGVAYVALEEYLSYVLPEKDYSQLVRLNSSGKYVAGSVDINSDGKYTIFDDAIMPMARDALGYILQSIVPTRKTDGTVWNVYKTDVVGDKTTVFDLLNSVVCYYASMDSYSDNGFNTSKGITGKGVGALLGAMDENGNCLVTNSNTLWQNIDAIANNLLPVLGTLQYGDVAHAAKFNSYELLYNKVIKGILDIGPNSGVTNIIKQLLTIFTAEPIRNKGVVTLVYDDVLASLLNNLLGARYSGQTYKQVMPYTDSYDSSAEYKAANPLHKMSAAQSASPFNSLVDVSILGKYSYTTNKANGILGLVIENIYEFFAYSDTNSNFRSSKTKQTGAAACWQGGMFAVKAVNNFIPSFVPQLGEHQFKPATVKVGITAATGVTPGASMSGNSLKFVNNSTGLNRFYRTANGGVGQDPRYYAVIRGIAVKMGNQNPSNIIVDRDSAVGKVVAPGEALNIAVSGTYPEETQNLSITVTYDIFESAREVTVAPDSGYLYQNLNTTSYMYLSPDKGWADALFNTVDASGIKGSSSRSGYIVSSPVGGSAGQTRAEYYKNFLIPDNNASVINDYGLMVTGGGSYDSMFSYPAQGTEYLAVTGVDADGKYVTGAKQTAGASATNLAYATFDNNGNLINTAYQDFKWASDAEWNRGDAFQGFDAAGIDTLIREKATVDADGNITSVPKYETRTHIAYTTAEAIENDVIRGIIKNGNSIEAILVDNSIVGTEVTPGTQLRGLSLMGGATLSNASQYIKWIQVLDNKKFAPQEFDMNLATITNNTVGMTGKTHINIYNNSGAAALQNKYDSTMSEMSPYDKSDFDDMVGEGTTAYSPVQNQLNQAFSNTVVALGSVITETSASKLSSITETVAKTGTTTSTTGSVAYAPLASTETLPESIKAFVKNGYYYADEDCTIPIYSNVELASAPNGKDAVGTAVQYNQATGKYYVVNAPSYETEWIIITDGDVECPYLSTTDVQAKADDLAKSPLYEQVSYNFYNAAGEQVGQSDWAYMIPQMVERIKPYDGTTDYRGTYQKYMDMLDYRSMNAKKHVDTSLANLIGQGVMEARKNMVNVDYIVDTYEKKVKVAKEAESLITATDIYLVDEQGNYVDAAGNIVDEKNKVVDHTEYSTSSPSVAINEAKRIYDRFDARVQSRGFISDKLEAEILCASGYTADKFTVVNGEVYYTSGVEAKYGAYDATGKLINPTVENEKMFSDKSWNNYVAALAAAITTVEEKTAKLSDIYTYKKNLAIAEMSLESPSARTEITVTGKISATTSVDGAASIYGIAGAKIKIGNKTYAVSGTRGEFTAVLPVGTTELHISANNAVDRTVTLTGENDIANVEIGLIVGDYNADGVVNSVDAFMFSKASVNDINGDGTRDSVDGAIINAGAKVFAQYSSLALD